MIPEFVDTPFKEFLGIKYRNEGGEDGLAIPSPVGFPQPISL
jgi:hypothetical protein